MLRRRGFWMLALLWLPAGVVATAVVRFAPEAGPMWLATLPMMLVSLVPVAPCGLPLALGCRRLWRLGYRQTAWATGIVLGALTVLSSLVAGLLGPLAIAGYAALISLPVWTTWWWLDRRDKRVLRGRSPALSEGSGQRGSSLGRGEP